MKVYCFTNLDVFCEHWPSELPARPMVGDIIRSNTVRRKGTLELQVCQVTIFCDQKASDDPYNPRREESWAYEVELTLIPSRWKCVSDFQKWYETLLG